MQTTNSSVLERVYTGEEKPLTEVVQRYQKVAPAVCRFAQTLANNEQLVVRLGLESAAYPHEIVCDPRIFQAAYRRSAPVTPEEVALASALHEVIHLVSSNFDERRLYPSHWPQPAEPPSDPLDIFQALELAVGSVGVSLFFAVEDARQEYQGLTQYAGASSVLADIYRSGLGVTLARLENLAAFGLGCFLIGGRYQTRTELESKVSGPVSSAWADATENLQDLITLTDPWQVAETALVLFRIAQAHGLITVSQPKNDRERQQQKEQAENLRDGLDQVRLFSPAVGDEESYQRTNRQHSPGNEPEVLAGKGSDQAATDLVVRMSQAASVFLPDGQTGKIVVSAAPASFQIHAHSGRTCMDEQNQAWGIRQRRVSGELFPLFAANQRRGLRSGYDQGDLSPHAALFIGAGLFQRLYERREVLNRRSYAVSLLVDGSASMLHRRPQEQLSPAPTWGMSAAILGAWTLSRMCDELQVDFEVAMFNRSFMARPSDTEWSYTRYRRQATTGLRQFQGSSADELTSTVNHYLLKSFEQRWRDTESTVSGVFWTATHFRQAAQIARKDPKNSPPVSMFEKAANVDEFNLSTAAKRLARWGAKTRVLIVLADGMTRGRVNTLASTARQIEADGTTVLGIGIGDDTVAQAYQRYQVVNHPEHLARAMVDGTRSALHNSLNTTSPISDHHTNSWWSPHPEIPADLHRIVPSR